MEIQLEIIAINTYTVDDAYQLSLKIGGSNFRLPDVHIHKLGVLSSIKQQANHQAQQISKLLTM